MRIPCPWCGPRPLEEFHYGGDAAKKRPVEGEQADLSVWYDYVYDRDNPAGKHREYWQHEPGCRSWLVVTRDTTTHQILNVEFARQANGEGES